MRIDWSTVPLMPGMRAGAERRAVAAERISVVRVTTSSDASFDDRVHRHEHEQWLLMLHGRLELEVEGDRFEVGPGDLVLFPSGSWHGAVGIGPDGAEYYEFFSPPRYDQLPGYAGPSPLEFRP